MMSNLLHLLAMISITAASKPSNGCEKPIPSWPSPGHHGEFFVTYQDKQQGPVERDYILQVPWYADVEPIPLVLDLHGWTGSSDGQVHTSPWKKVALAQNFMLLWPNGMADSPNQMGSWNCSSTEGPKGAICDTNREQWGPIECYGSCPLCSALSSCDWTSCHDDIGFIGFLIDKISEEWCIDLDQIHLSGISNGGMFAYYVASMATDGLGFASINPVAASSLIGFGQPPPEANVAFSIIDMHGIADDTIPYDYEHSFGYGPENSLLSYDGYYYDDKASLLKSWADKMGCEELEHPYHTPYDGQAGFKCFEKLCHGGKAIVRCFGDYGHDYPLSKSKTAAAEVAYRFMASHPRGL